MICDFLWMFVCVCVCMYVCVCVCVCVCVWVFSGNWPCGNETETLKCFQDIGGNNENSCVTGCSAAHFENTSTTALATGKCTIVPCASRTNASGSNCVYVYVYVCIVLTDLLIVCVWICI
jgi:hypothetical protein